jgi:hypothetical protein
MVNAGWEFVGAPQGGPIPYGMRATRADQTITTVGERESKCGGRAEITPVHRRPMADVVLRVAAPNKCGTRMRTSGLPVTG